jgi:hypothetical protein
MTGPKQPRARVPDGKGGREGEAERINLFEHLPANSAERIAELRPPPVTSTVGMLGRQSVIGQPLKAGAPRSRAVARAFVAVLLACFARSTRIGSSRWLCSTAFLASAALIETWPSSRRR